jgi:hypothetical protein
MRQAQVLILSGAATGSVTGSKIDVNQAVSASFQVLNGGDLTIAGTLKLQVSNQICEPQTDRYNFVPTEWSDIPNATTTITAGVASAIVVPNMCMSYIRAVFTRTGGAGTVQVVMSYLSI